ncbi:MAG: aldose 1-epimerase family protein [Spirochaetes bacterium]|nr:aldose 1-epimerase family protein [Spirochaetota bacterium]
MIPIGNGLISARIESSGAQMRSLRREPEGLELLWTGEDPRFWRNSAPILFPIVGALPDSKYNYRGRVYTMQNHGFSRSREFEVTKAEASSVELVLRSDEETRAQYPFDFELKIGYSLEGLTLSQRFTITNTGLQSMPFSFGGHPGFRCPAFPGERYEDYSLVFEKHEAGECRMKEGPLLAEKRYPFLEGGRVFHLDKKRFASSAILLDHLESKSVSLVSSGRGRLVTLGFEGFTHLGLWSGAGEDPFVCIEPWYGIDSRADFRTLEEKEGILTLKPGETESAAFTIEG